MRKIMCRNVVTLDKFTLCNIRRRIATLIVAQLTRASALRRFGASQTGLMTVTVDMEVVTVLQNYIVGAWNQHDVSVVTYVTDVVVVIDIVLVVETLGYGLQKDVAGGPNFLSTVSAKFTALQSTPFGD